MPNTNQQASIELLTYPLTHNPIKISLLLKYLDSRKSSQDNSLLVTSRTIHLDQLEHQSEDFIAINPNRKVPALIDGSTVVWESNAILHHLANRFESDVWPRDTNEQNQVIRWLMWEASRWSQTIGDLLKHTIYFPFWGYDGNPEEIEKQSRRLRRLLDVLDQELQTQPYLAGPSLTIADFSIAAPLIYAAEIGLNLDDHSAVKLWLNELSQSHWWQQCLSELNTFRAQSTSTKLA